MSRFGQTRRATQGAAMILLVAASLAASPSYAALGERTGNTSANAQLVLNGAAYERSYTESGGSTVHEYSNITGQVFAYTWEGPTSPNLRTLLGNRFDTYRNTATQAHSYAQHTSLHMQHVASDQMIVESGGAMRDFQGRAWLPAQMPSGISISDLQ